MDSYIEAMKSAAYAAFDRIFSDVSSVRFVDFPDHRNVGDSAIAMGQLSYFASRGIRVKSIHCIGTFDDRILKSRDPVVINGGGNIAGFFAGIDRHRNNIGLNLAAETLLIQAPQSIYFNDQSSKNEFRSSFAARPNLRLAVRDSEAVSTLAGVYADPILAPDAVHILGRIAAPAPTQAIFVLKRQDQESATTNGGYESADWDDDSGFLALAASLRWKAKYSGPMKPVFNLSPRGWEKTANGRLERGVRLLSSGETLITDRLHAMLLGLQMGRRVIAVDNNNKKLSKYAETWFPASRPDVVMASSFEEAVALV